MNDWIAVLLDAAPDVLRLEVRLPIGRIVTTVWVAKLPGGSRYPEVERHEKGDVPIVWLWEASDRYRETR